MTRQTNSIFFNRIKYIWQDKIIFSPKNLMNVTDNSFMIYGLLIPILWMIFTIISITFILYKLNKYQIVNKMTNILKNKYLDLNIPIKLLGLWLSWLIRYEKFPKEYSLFYDFQSLLPYDGLKWNETFNALHWALSEPNVNNIAITGYFGSGKSSFWESYKKQVEEEKKEDNPLKNRDIINISLAKFSCKCDKDFKYNDNSSENCKFDVKQVNSGYKVFSSKEISNYDQWKIYQEQKKKEEELEIEIERGILEQILYSVENDDIPASRFKKLKDTSDKDLLCKSFLSLIFILCVFLFSNTDKFIYLSCNHTAMFLLSIFFIFICLYAFLLHINPIHLSKISCHQFDIHFEDNKGGLFSQNITELVYFFEKMKNKRIVVFEDLDRFKSTTIFSKLRELNHILNNIPNIKSNQIIFIYMIRDDIFSKYERTKFFDFIVPIVPVMTKDNAAGFIISKMPHLEKDLGRDYIDNISTFLSDLRMLKNCENEYRIYKETNEQFLKSRNQNKRISQSTYQWIFSLILYKNLYPKDFQKLLQHEGLLYYCLNKAKNDYYEAQKKLEKSKSKENQNV